jgi:hypothetical protein
MGHGPQSGTKTPTAQIKLSSLADGHYRNFGRDIEADFAAGMPDHQIIAVTAPDPATGIKGMTCLITRSARLHETTGTTNRRRG